MKLYSTKDKNYIQTLSQAVIEPLAPLGGLYMPMSIGKMEHEFFANLSSMSLPEIGIAVCSHLFDDNIPLKDIEQIVTKAINFPAPLVRLTPKIASLELWHGPSLAFKDFGARFMAELISYFNEGKDKKTTVLVATSGDTGGAVAFGFLGVPNVEVIILYPSGKVSDLQEKQLTTLGQNITALEVKGTFDDCQALVKQAFLDKELQEKYNLSSANSINIARLIPQSFYYFEAFKSLDLRQGKPVFSVPSGNFGNLTAGLFAYKMGLPIHQFIAATNVNNIVPNYLSTGKFIPKPSISTVSNAMDVGNPSNFARMEDLMSLEEMQQLIIGAYADDAETLAELAYMYQSTGYIGEPHGAVAHLALRQYLDQHPDCQGVFLETAHPAKFIDIVNDTLNTEVPIPERLAILADRQKVATPMPINYTSFKKYLLDR